MANEPQAQIPVPIVPAVAEQAGFGVKLGVIGFLLVYITLALIAVMDGLFHSYGMVLSWLGVGVKGELPPLFMQGLTTILGAMLGGGTLDLLSFHRYVSVKKDFQLAHVWGYFFAPWFTSVLGIMVFALLHSGLLVFSPQTQSEGTGGNGLLAYFVIGFLSGYGWPVFAQRLQSLVAKMFAEPAEHPEKNKIKVNEHELGGESVKEQGPVQPGTAKGTPMLSVVESEKSKETSSTTRGNVL